MRIVLVLSAMFMAAPPVMAWNSVGHMAISKLAYDRLDEGQQLRLFNLLKKHPHYDAFLAHGRPDGVSEAEWAIMRCSVWPDWVRLRKPETRGEAVTKFHRGEEHYINIPLIEPGEAELFAGKTLVDPDLPNIVTALKTRANELRSRTMSEADRAVAMCWMFHLIGDIHQPLHNCTFFSKARGLETGDLGGNKFGVKVAGKKWKLHAFWDDLLGEDANYNDDSPAHQQKLYRAAIDAAARLRGIELAETDRKRLEVGKTFESWSKEGNELAVTVGYRAGEGTDLLKCVVVPFDAPIPDDAPEAGESYLKRAKATADVQAILAGRRLQSRITPVLKN